MKKQYGTVVGGEIWDWFDTPEEAYQAGVINSFGRDFIIIKKLNVKVEITESMTNGKVKK